MSEDLVWKKLCYSEATANLEERIQLHEKMGVKDREPAALTSDDCALHLCSTDNKVSECVESLEGRIWVGNHTATTHSRLRRLQFEQLSPFLEAASHPRRDLRQASQLVYCLRVDIVGKWRVIRFKYRLSVVLLWVRLGE